MSSLMSRRKRDLAEAWKSQSRSSSCLQMRWWLSVILRLSWCHKHSISVLTLKKSVLMLNIIWGALVCPRVATHLVFLCVCALYCCCWLLFQTDHIIKRQVQARSGGSQSWGVSIMTHLERRYLHYFFFPPLPFKLSLGLWKKVGFFKDKSPQADFPQSSSFSHGHLRSAVICRLIRGRACPSWPCLWQRHLGLHVREEWLVSPARESCRTWLGENGQLTGDRRNFFPLRLLNLVLFFVMNQHWFSVLMFWFILVCASWFLDAAGSL